MLNSYANLKFTEGPYAAGTCFIKAVPREWLLYPIAADFNTGKIIDEILLQPGREFIKLELVPDSYEFDEKPKSNKGGNYFVVTVQGTLNNLTPELLLTLETLRNHELVVILKDRRQRWRVTGDQDAGMTLQFSNKEDSTRQGGLQTVAIDLSMDAEKAALFYEI